MPSLKEQFAAAPREVGGGRNSNRTDYQKDWALCHLLEIHEAREDYALVVERHDDVVVLDHSSEPKRADFYQIKTKDNGDWKLANLLYVERSRSARDKADDAERPEENGVKKKAKKQSVEKKMSFLAKLYSNRLACLGSEMTASFVSNARFNLILAKGGAGLDRTEICFNELSAADLEKILSKLKVEHELAEAPDCAHLFYFRRSDLGVNNHTDCARGKTAKFMADRNLGDAQSVAAFYRALFEEIKLRTNYEDEPGSFEGIIRRKSITKAGFQGMLDALRNPRDIEATTARIEGDLRQEGLAFTATRAIIRDCRRVFLESRSNALPKAVYAACEQIVRNMHAPDQEHSLRSLIDLGLARLKERNMPGTELFADTYLTALLLMAIYEY
ncbi:dsDNA nuclease domain-containing protein [Paludisphaera rhizosphaerae]|uniref:dsDNA nuclease domain-containing protein n=1 Tax=Paludisphaera rhizosphaerae TaxID=2711216 RepID=UPI0013EA9EEC|nr:dsDNA nuclease domain-containing protein [Paludisphaera rhizosphaerae]